ncbi:trypsin-like peptidase domain-containing protein [Streptomyces sp. NRRL WC-3742]|uniref:trypsin-like peptidase domain-containing protein n=1 Tax=Streptomyces sp. NRRL WC-3742 TaxID=1463934 RepID=UPI000689BFF5|nr:trypsin-like peptidase domain-containing protein [Streptomyces sp. NRRL WC-3742]
MPGWHEGDPGCHLLRICDLNGRLHGLGFVADPQGTVLTAHEAVAGLDRLLLHTPGGQSRVLGPEAVLPLPAHGLALLRTEAQGGLPVPPLPVAAAGGGHEVLLPVPAGDGERVVALRCGLLGASDGVLLLDVPVLNTRESAGVEVPAGAPVLDARSGAVVALAAPGLRSPRYGGALPAVPAGGGALPAAGALAEVLARNAAAVPGYGAALNLAGVLRLAAAQLAAAPGVAGLAADRVDRPDASVGEEPESTVTALVGGPGSGRSTELAALALRRAAAGLPTLWLRGADLRAGDRSLAEPVERALAGAAAALGVPAPTPEPAAALCAAAGRPLLIALDGPEEAPVPLEADRLYGAGQWLTGCGARLLTACGEETWERLAERPWRSGPGPGLPREEEPARDGDLAAAPTVRMDGGGPGGPTLAGLRLGPLPAEAAERMRRRYGLPPGRPEGAGARHPLAVRLAGELWAEGVQGEAARRAELFSAHLDLLCLRTARRLADGGRTRGAHRRGAARAAEPRPGRVRRLAAAVAGRVHEAARRMLGGSEAGALGRAAFEELFPAEGGWGAAVLAEGLFVPAGPGFRFAHGEFADWLQGLHLDLDAALRLLLGEAEDIRPGAGANSVPRHRIGPVAAALTRVADTWGADSLDPWLHRLARALELRPAGSEPAWWAARLLADALAGSPDPAQHRDLLGRLAERIAERAAEAGGFAALPADGLGRFGPAFWTGLGLPVGDELALLRRLVTADPGFLRAVAERLRAAPVAVFPLLCAWFDEGAADLAHELLYAHRRLALDELADALADAAHPRADALLTVLAAEEPSALCRAVDRWSHDRRPERHVAAAVHALSTAPYAGGPGTELLRYTALTLLAREDEPGLHGAALALLVRDPDTRAEHLPAALALLRAGGDAFLTPRALAPALESDPEPVLAVFAELPAAPEVLRVLADTRAPRTARRGADLAARLLRAHPEQAGPVALDYLGRRLAGGGAGAAARLELRMLLAAALGARTPEVRRPFAEVLSVPVADPAADALRCELLDDLLAAETDPEVLTAAVERLAEHCAAEKPARVRAVLARATPGLPGADQLLVHCAGRSAAFARLLARWPRDAAPTAPDGPRLARLRALVAAGRDPQYAAAEAERAPLEPVMRPTRIPVPEPGQAHGTL